MRTVMIIGLVLFGLNLQANPLPKPTNEVLRAEKKASYYTIKARLLKNEITLKQAQKMWLKELKKFRKREGK